MRVLWVVLGSLMVVAGTAALAALGADLWYERRARALYGDRIPERLKAGGRRGFVLVQAVAGLVIGASILRSALPGG